MWLYVLAFSTHIKHRGQEYQIDLVDTAGQVSTHSECGIDSSSHMLNLFFHYNSSNGFDKHIFSLLLYILCMGYDPASNL